MAGHSPTGNETITWIVDSGASSHMTPNKHQLVDYEEFFEPELITIGDGKKLKAFGHGNVHFRTSEFTGTLINVLWIPDLKANLFSVGRAMEMGCNVEFTRENSEVHFYRKNRLVLSGSRKEESNYFLIEMTTNENRPIQEKHAFVGASLTDWHKRLGHCSIDTLKALAKSDAVKGMKISNLPKHQCEACTMGKLCRTHLSLIHI